MTAASSLGTVTSDTNGIVAAGSFTATDGDIVEFSHARLPLTFRLKLAATAALAYTQNTITAYVMENLATLNATDTALLYAADNDNPNVEPFYIGSGQTGTTVEIPYSTTTAKNLRIYARSQNENEIAKTHFDTASYDDIAIPGSGVFTYGSFALNDNADDHKLTVRVAENLSADRILNILVNNVSRTLSLKNDLYFTGLASAGGIQNTGIGEASLAAPTSGSNNFAGGYGALNAVSSGSSNIANGTLSLGVLTTGSTNTAIGAEAGKALVSGSQNTFVGGFAGYSNLGSANVMLGYTAGYDETGSSKLYIETDYAMRATPLIGGDFSARTLTFNGSVTIADAKNIVLNTTTGSKIGTATGQKLGLWNATPIVQPTTAVAAATFAANTSGIANDTATFDGYTIGQVVKALRNIGALA